jgi:phage-related protein
VVCAAQNQDIFLAFLCLNRHNWAMAGPLKPVWWIGSTKEDLLALPEEVQHQVGFALYQVQLGKVPAEAKPLKGFGGASVQEIVVDYHRDTYRAVYTVRFADRVYVLHVFQKKAKSGIATPKSELELIERRLKQATAMEKTRRTSS